jgi:hypothetical protein
LYRRLNRWLDAHGALGDILVALGWTGLVVACVVAFIATLAALGLIEDMHCPPGSREMRYGSGKITHHVCAVEVPPITPQNGS